MSPSLRCCILKFFITPDNTHVYLHKQQYPLTFTVGKVLIFCEVETEILYIVCSCKGLIYFCFFILVTARVPPSALNDYCCHANSIDWLRLMSREVVLAASLSVTPSFGAAVC